MDHLEGIGSQLPYRGPSVPFVAVPTTGRDRSEATKNAVLSVPWRGGFKKSFRDESLVAQVAVVDRTCGGLSAGADRRQRHGCADQLLESYLSTRRTRSQTPLGPIRSDLRPRRIWGLVPRRRPPVGAAGSGSVAAAARERMAYSALCSGICLAQAGLGAVTACLAVGRAIPDSPWRGCGATSRGGHASQHRRPRGGAIRKCRLARYAPSAGSSPARPGAGDGRSALALVSELERSLPVSESRGSRPFGISSRRSRPSSPTAAAAA